MKAVEHKPLLTRDDLPMKRIVEICQRWKVSELAIDTTQRRPSSSIAHSNEADPFAAVDLYLIADFGPGDYEWGFKKHHFDVVDELERLLGSHVWITDRGILEKHVADGAGWARHEKESRDVIYSAV